MRAPTLVRPGPAEYRERGSVAVFTVIYVALAVTLVRLLLLLARRNRERA